MAWYDAGTVNVTLNSATVTGVGTQWVAGARQGEAFVGPDGRLYEVLNIASNTSLTLTRPYRGATQAAQPYALAPFQGYVKELADRAAELLRRYSDALVLAEGAVQKTEMMSADNLFVTTGRLGLVRGAFGVGGDIDWRSGPVDPRSPPSQFFSMGCVRGFAEGSSATARKGLGIPALGDGSAYGVFVVDAQYKDASGARGIQRQFTCLNGRRFLSGAESATAWGPWVEALSTAGNLAGLADVAAARSNLGLKSAAIADLIGDVGAGAVMQSGSNANGRWWRFQNGLQVCTKSDLVRPFLDQSIGTNLWSTRDVPWTFPLTFISGGHVSVSGWSGPQAGNAWVGMGNGITTVSACTLRVMAGYSNSNESTFSACAIGGWK